MLSVDYAECLKLSIMLSVVILNVVMLSWRLIWGLYHKTFYGSNLFCAIVSYNLLLTVTSILVCYLRARVGAYPSRGVPQGSLLG
jgi:hypothetical protein